MQHNKLFESTSPNKLFIRCAIPSMISMAVTSLYTVADGIFVGRFIGADALAAINIVMPFIMISFALADMVAVGSSVQIAIRMGEQKNEEASRIFSFSSLLIVLIACIAGAAGLLFAAPLVSLLGADAKVTALAVEYMRVYALFSPIIMVFFAIDNYLRICGKVRYSMLMNVFISIGNILLDWLFIVKLQWGIGSAALASCLCLAAGTLIGYLPFLCHKLPLQLVRGKISLRLVGNILANGSSEFFSNISGSVLMLIINTVLLHLSGAMAVAAFSIVMYIDSIVNSLLFGMADSLQPAISYNFGARNKKRIFALEKRLLLVGAILSITVMLLMQQGGQYIVPLFIDDHDPTLVNMSIRAMELFSLSYIVAWLPLISSSFFTAVDRPAFSLTVAFSQTLVFPLLGLALLPHFLGLDGVWLVSLSTEFLTAIMAVFLYRATIKKMQF